MRSKNRVKLKLIRRSSKQLDFLKKAKVDYIQGYYFSKPLNKEDFVALLNKSGNYPYSFGFIDMDIERCFIPISELNELRNKAFELLKNELISTNIVEENTEMIT